VSPSPRRAATDKLSQQDDIVEIDQDISDSVHHHQQHEANHINSKNTVHEIEKSPKKREKSPVKVPVVKKNLEKKSLPTSVKSPEEKKSLEKKSEEIKSTTETPAKSNKGSFYRRPGSQNMSLVGGRVKPVGKPGDFISMSSSFVLVNCIADCLSNLSFVITGVMSAFSREDIEDIVKNHDGKVKTAVSGKTR